MSKVFEITDDQLAQEKSGELKVVKINVDDWFGAAQAYNVINVPTLILVKDKKEVGRVIGAKTKEQLITAL